MNTAPSVCAVIPQYPPPTYLVLNIFTLLCCCFLFGLIGLFYSIQVCIIMYHFKVAYCMVQLCCMGQSCMQVQFMMGLVHATCCKQSIFLLLCTVYIIIIPALHVVLTHAVICVCVCLLYNTLKSKTCSIKHTCTHTHTRSVCVL